MVLTDPRVSHLPLVGPPWSMICILVLYNLLVLKWGPRIMAKRQAYDITILMQAYNLVQIGLNSYIFVSGLRHSVLQPYYSITCQSHDSTDTRPAMMNLRYPAYAYYISKYMDLLDTVFFLLRKKNNQITFLHVYHHTVMVIGCWIYMTLLFGSHYVCGGILNSFIHVCMYSYYFVAALKLNTFNLLLWKRRLTQMQLLQFCAVCVHLTMPVLNNWCKLTPFWLWLSFIQNVMLFLLFVDFYIKTYLRQKPKKT